MISYSRGIEGEAERRVARRFTVAYMLAIIVIALLSAAHHIILDKVIAEQRDSAAMIDLVGQQRMLSQRIALLAGDLAAGDKSARAPLADAAGLLERTQNAVVHGGDLNVRKPLSQQARARYFQGEHPLDPVMRRFLAEARAVAASGQEQDAAAAVRTLRTTARDTLLPLLDGAVTEFVSEANDRIHRLQQIRNVILVVLFATLAVQALLIFRPLVLRLGGYISSLTEQATRDALTGLLNRRYFLEIAQQLLLMSRRDASPTAVLAIDLDHFKRINDTLGHRAGDAALRRFAEITRDTVRRSDLIGRMGGEEFAVVLLGVDRHAARIVAEKLRRRFEEDKPKDSPPFTASIGVVLAGEIESISDLLNHADAAVYVAKQNGRNRVEFYVHGAEAQRGRPSRDTADPAGDNRSMNA
jgi:diguanylate cyclase (GGDEF)-like protein